MTDLSEYRARAAAEDFQKFKYIGHAILTHSDRPALILDHNQNGKFELLVFFLDTYEIDKIDVIEVKKLGPKLEKPEF